jgi:hypothetical protein
MPLPKPRAGEERANFVDRCIVDLNVVNDFRSMEQRMAVCNSLYEQEKEIKSVSENWGTLFEAELKRAERESIKDFRDYYSSQYNKASAQFILTGNLNQADLSAYFQNNDLQNMYRDMYEKIGLRFANWYAKHWKKALAKATDINGYQSIWQAKFAYIGEQVGAQRVTLVAGTAKDTLIKITQQAMRDPQFMSLGDKEKARILRSQFDKYSDYQARRLVRTESTNAANFATMQSASDLFPAQEMNKVWITAIDGRERPAHHSANRQTVQFIKPFIVGGESLMHPGDSNGSAGNVINCRCSVAPIPRPNAQTIGEAITDIGFGMAQAQVESAISSAFITPEVAQIISTEVVAQMLDETLNAETFDEARQNAERIFTNNGLKISQITNSKELPLDDFNKINNQLKVLTDEYKVDSVYNKAYGVNLTFESTSKSYGWVRTTDKGDLVQMNFGHKSDSIFNRTRVNSATQFFERNKSAIDATNAKIATATHEFAHVLTVSETQNAGLNKKFYSELKEINNRYVREMNTLELRSNYDEMNRIYLGQYANANIDEFMAEGFTEYKLNSNPSRYAVEIGQLIDKYFKK